MPVPTSSPTHEPGSRRPLSRIAARLLARARDEWDQRRFTEAEHTLTSVLALAPDDPEATALLGMVAQRLGDHVRAVDCFRRVLPLRPDDPSLLSGLGLSLFSIGEIDEATRHLRRVGELQPTSASAWFNLGEALWRQARVGEAVAVLKRAIELNPAHVSARLSLARAQGSLGDVDAAVAGFREVVRLDPANADGWYGLSLNSVFAREDVERLQRVFERADLPVHTHYLTGFAFAKALEDQRDFARAFEVYRLANAAQYAGTETKWNAAAERALIERTMAVFAGDIATAPDATQGSEVIFVTSMPRSGSTLVEHILASHPEVEGANEIKDMREILDEESRRRGAAFPAWAPTAMPRDWQRLGAEYLARTERWRRDKPRFTDKNLLNWRVVGATLAMLPAARVIVVRRDPVETCLACYRQCFNEEQGYACNIDDLADYCAGFLRLGRFWLQRYPGRVLDLPYEALVADPEAGIRRLLDFCGLPFDPACLEPHRTARAVLTPSSAQVRQPLRRGTARSAHYAEQLRPLRARLLAAGVEMD